MDAPKLQPGMLKKLRSIREEIDAELGGDREAWRKACEEAGKWLKETLEKPVRPRSRRSKPQHVQP